MKQVGEWAGREGWDEGQGSCSAVATLAESRGGRGGRAVLIEWGLAKGAPTGSVGGVVLRVG